MISIKSKTKFFNRKLVQTKPRKFSINSFPPVQVHIRHEPSTPDPHKLIPHSPFKTGTTEDLEKYYTNFRKRKPGIRTRMAPRIERTTV